MKHHIIRVHPDLARCIPYYVCCYSNSEPSINHSFYEKNRSLRTRAMDLVINLTIVDMFVGGFSHFSLFVTSLSVMRHCAISALNPGTAINNWLSFRLVSSDLSYKYCSNFVPIQPLGIASLKSETTG